MNSNKKKAVALKYNQEQEHAPRVAAAGQGRIADTIIDKAKKNHVPMLEDPSLVELLAALNINETIPEELYQAVAEVFSFIYHADQNIKSNTEQK